MLITDADTGALVPRRAFDLAAQLSESPAPVVDEALRLARDHGASLEQPGEGSTIMLWDQLSRLAARNLTAARVLEPHLDAIAILRQSVSTPAADAALAAEGRTWGVFAAEGAAPRLTARQSGSGWTLTGRKPWCSLADRLSHALVTAWTGPSTRRLFIVDLAHAGVVPDLEATWVAHGLADVPSGPVSFTDVPADPVGEDGWYLSRPGFWWGGIGVAACWYGGAVGVARRLAPRGGREPDQIANMHLGAADADLYAARSALREAAAAVDDAGTDAAEGQLLALRVRSVVRDVAERVLLRTAHATGPAPLALEAEHAQRVSDLELYIRQEHAERDSAALGGLLSSRLLQHAD